MASMEKLLLIKVSLMSILRPSLMGFELRPFKLQSQTLTTKLTPMCHTIITSIFQKARSKRCIKNGLKQSDNNLSLIVRVITNTSYIQYWHVYHESSNVV